MNYKTLFAITFQVTILFIVFSCHRDNDSCDDGDINSIVSDEKLAFQFFGMGNESIFKDDFKMDSLKIFENENELDFTIDSTYYFEAPMVYFVSNITKWDSIESNLGDTLNTQILIEFGANKIDTLRITSVPNKLDNPCGGYAYDYVKMTYNSNTLLNYAYNGTTTRGAVSCGTLTSCTVYVYE